MEARNRSARKYGFACLVCRRRKIRCGGEKPTCHNCLKAGNSCCYKAGDILVTDLRSELGRTQARVKELEDALKRLALLGHDDRDKLLLDLVADLGHQQPRPARPNTEDPTNLWTTFDGQEAENSPSQGELEQAELSVDEYGEACPPARRHPALSLLLTNFPACSCNILAPRRVSTPALMGTSPSIQLTPMLTTTGSG